MRDALLIIAIVLGGSSVAWGYAALPKVKNYFAWVRAESRDTARDEWRHSSKIMHS